MFWLPITLVFFFPHGAAQSCPGSFGATSWKAHAMCVVQVPGFQLSSTPCRVAGVLGERHLLVLPACDTWQNDFTKHVCSKRDFFCCKKCGFKSRMHHARRSRLLYLESQGSWSWSPARRELQVRNFACSPLHGLDLYNLAFRQAAIRGPAMAVPWLIT